MPKLGITTRPLILRPHRDMINKVGSGEMERRCKGIILEMVDHLVVRPTQNSEKPFWPLRGICYRLRMKPTSSVIKPRPKRTN